ncbi:MAG: shikimate kinase [Deltaproteobacteria bacterium]|nr:shikimate kinase [Deltaproteobacteria bacterium]
MHNIVLTGFMGTGKSTVGRILAKELDLKPVDLDELIEKEAGMAVKDIFRVHGEARFREMEAEVIKKLSSGAFGQGLIVSTGGGAVLNPLNRDSLRKWGTLVCLTASVDEIIKRVGDRGERPLLATGDKRQAVLRLLKEREDAYRDCDIEVDTTSIDARGVADKIKSFIQKNK